MSLDLSDNSMITAVMWYWIISKGTLSFGYAKRLSSPGPGSIWAFFSLSSQHPPTCLSEADEQCIIVKMQRTGGLACPDCYFLFGRCALFATTWDRWLVKGMHESSPWWGTCLTCSWQWRQPVCELITQPVARGETLPRISQKSGDTASTLITRTPVSLQASGFL